MELRNEASRKFIAPFARRRGIYETAFVRFRRKSIRKARISEEGALSNRAKNTGIVVSPPVTRLSCGSEKWELDIRSNVESVTRFSVIESKISLKNERRSRCISALLHEGRERGERKGEETPELESGMRGKQAAPPSLLPLLCKNRSSSGSAAQLEFDIACIRCTPHPIVRVKRIKYFLATDGSGEFQWNDSTARRFAGISLAN